jgi:DnaJ-domain-containing protein 1
MANMSYCRFENTAGDMNDCLNDLVDAVDAGLSMAQFMDRLSSAYERRSVQRMIDLLGQLSEAFEQLEANEGLTEAQLEEFDEA